MKLRSIVFVALAFLATMNSYALSFKEFLEERVRNTVVEKTLKSLGGASQSSNGDAVSSEQNYVAKGFEQDKDWQDIFQMMYDATKKVNEGLLSSGLSLELCSAKIVENLYLNEKEFNNKFNIDLGKQVDYPSQFLNVSSFGDLSNANTNSYLEANPFRIPNVSAINYLMFKKDNKNSSIYNNSSAIMIPIRFKLAIDEQMIVVGRTAQIDAQDLYVATLRDMSNVGYLIVKNPKFGINFEEYFQSVLNLYVRNKVMCLYNINP